MVIITLRIPAQRITAADLAGDGQAIGLSADGIGAGLMTSPERASRGSLVVGASAGLGFALVRALLADHTVERVHATCRDTTQSAALSGPFQSRVAPSMLFDPDRAAARLLAVAAGLTAADNGEFFAWNGQRIAWKARLD